MLQFAPLELITKHFGTCYVQRGSCKLFSNYWPSREASYSKLQIQFKEILCIAIEFLSDAIYVPQIFSVSFSFFLLTLALEECSKVYLKNKSRGDKRFLLFIHFYFVFILPQLL